MLQTINPSHILPTFHILDWLCNVVMKCRACTLFDCIVECDTVIRMSGLVFLSHFPWHQSQLAPGQEPAWIVPNFELTWRPVAVDSWYSLIPEHTCTMLVRRNLFIICFYVSIFLSSSWKLTAEFKVAIKGIASDYFHFLCLERRWQVSQMLWEQDGRCVPLTGLSG